MNWEIRIKKSVQKSLQKADLSVSRRIIKKLREISTLENPWSIGKPLTGNLSGLWHYRVGAYRIICSIEDEMLLVLVVDIEHRSAVYKIETRLH